MINDSLLLSNFLFHIFSFRLNIKYAEQFRTISSISTVRVLLFQSIGIIGIGIVTFNGQKIKGKRASRGVLKQGTQLLVLLSSRYATDFNQLKTCHTFWKHVIPFPIIFDSIEEC